MKHLFFAAFVSSLIVTVSCGPPAPQPETGTVRSIHDLAVDVNDRTMTVSWSVSGDALIVGYNIYITDEPLVGKYPDGNYPDHIEPFNHTPFAGDTDPSDGIEHFDALGLENGRQYYVSVRVVNADRSLSRPSEEQAAICGPRGEITLLTRFTGDNDGFSFTLNKHVRADAVENDLYFYSKDGVDYLASPSRLDGFLRATRLSAGPVLREMVRGILDGGVLSNPQHTLLRSANFVERVEVIPGSIIHVQTPEQGIAVLLVLDFEGQGEGRRAKLAYAYDPSGASFKHEPQS